MADFWRDQAGELVVRLSSKYGYSFHFTARLLNGKTVPDEDLDDFSQFIEHVLIEWEGTDDTPDWGVDWSREDEVLPPAPKKRQRRK